MTSFKSEGTRRPLEEGRNKLHPTSEEVCIHPGAGGRWRWRRPSEGRAVREEGVGENVFLRCAFHVAAQTTFDRPPQVLWLFFPQSNNKNVKLKLVVRSSFLLPLTVDIMFTPTTEKNLRQHTEYFGEMKGEPLLGERSPGGYHGPGESFKGIFYEKLRLNSRRRKKRI